MDHIEVGKYWDENAEVWTKLARTGYDIYRDHLNTPTFLEMLPNAEGLKGLDIGCGEGYNTRKVAELGAKMTAIDISSTFIKYAKEHEGRKPCGIEYHLASAVELPFDEESFDFAMATMSFMDVPETEKVIKEAWRVLKPNGFLQFSITHPCFFTPKWGWVRGEKDEKIALKCGDYFSELRGRIDEWIFGAAPDELKKKMPKFKTPDFYMTLSHWLNLLIDAGFILERFAEPTANDKTVEQVPGLADTQIIAYFLIIRCRKGGDK